MSVDDHRHILSGIVGTREATSPCCLERKTTPLFIRSSRNARRKQHKTRSSHSYLPLLFVPSAVTVVLRLRTVRPNKLCCENASGPMSSPGMGHWGTSPPEVCECTQILFKLWLCLSFCRVQLARS